MEGLRSQDTAIANGNVEVTGRTLLRRHCGEPLFKVTVTDQAVLTMLYYHACGVCGHNKFLRVEYAPTM